MYEELYLLKVILPLYKKQIHASVHSCTCLDMMCQRGEAGPTVTGHLLPGWCTHRAKLKYYWIKDWTKRRFFLINNKS